MATGGSFEHLLRFCEGNTRFAELHGVLANVEGLTGFVDAAFTSDSCEVHWVRSLRAVLDAEHHWQRGITGMLIAGSLDSIFNGATAASAV